MTTTAASNVRFGGSGFGPDYSVGQARRRITGESEDDTGQSSSSSIPRQGKAKDKEHFLFTVREPIRSVLHQLMTLIKDTLEENPVEHIETPEAVSGPLGYTAIFAVRPVQFTGPKTVFRPVVR